MCCTCLIIVAVLVVAITVAGLVLGLVHNEEGVSLWDQVIDWIKEKINF